MSMIRDLRAAVRPAVLRRRTALTVVPDPVAAGDCVVDCAVYRDGSRQQGRTAPETAIQDVHARGDGFVWIGLHEPTADELAGIAERFGLHPLAVEDAVKAHQRPKLERYDDTLFAVFKTVRYVEHEHLTSTSEVVETGEIMVFLGRNFVVTVRHGLHGGLGELRHRLEETPDLLAAGPSSVLHAVADRVVDAYLDVTQSMQDDIDEVENEVFGNRGSGDAGRIYQLKRELLELKRAVTPLARPMQTLAERPMRQVHPDIREYFRDVEDHLARVSEQIASFDELLTSILQANLAQVTVAQNEDMRRISAWVAIFAVPTMIAGIYGMNFDHMPELHWRYGYPTVLGVTLTVCLLIRRGFRRNGWL
ncbi:magnesium/cobalt transporter CorA [Yinghuangia sp. ASG 101]|uniref:magnesium/cobalt transporter CorA n=1 Tax=Yinghuangia sp. ASG 101 TaxID=2896848 RepID=UPI001E2C3CBF|nr:magnesium/cobalt transporter CorA [Yinghuangia sp. ASG 101]UGQ14422.1 magnesium/cobalt transporter CorA [Yinghuangia sp. ASG 101]